MKVLAYNNESKNLHPSFQILVRDLDFCSK
uniref:Uncharacterized protein n=1 Tax=Arundo donax TaxID=35708 RepID=A0A0A9A719_ARUDO